MTNIKIPKGFDSNILIWLLDDKIEKKQIDSYNGIHVLELSFPSGEKRLLYFATEQ